jgi:tight adherence protein B
VKRMRSTLAVFAACIAGFVGAIGAAGPTSGAQPDEQDDVLQITRVDLADQPQVHAEISVPAALSAPALGADAVDVRVDGVGVDADVVALPASRLEVVLAIDSSGSMSEGRAIDSAKLAAQAFLDVLPAETQIGVFAFADQPSLVSPLTTDRDALRWAINSITAKGETALFDALTFAGALFSGTTDDRRLVILSDGGDTVSANSIDDALAAAAGISVSVIELVSSEANHDALVRIADNGGGSLISVDDPDSLELLFQQIARTLVHRYRVSFATTATGSVDLAIRVTTPAGVLQAIESITLPSAPAPSSPTTTSPAVAPTTPTNSGTSPSGVAEPAEDSGASIGAAEGDADADTTMLALGAGAVFVAVALLVVIAFPFRPRRDPSRLAVADPYQTHEAEPTTRTGRVTRSFERLLERIGRRASLARALDIAGITLGPGEYVVLVLLGGAVVALALIGLIGPAAILVAAAGAVLVGWQVVAVRTARRRKAFADQLPDVLQLMVSSLRAGYALPQTLEAAASQSAEPTRTELQRILFQARVGRDLSDALAAGADRMQSRDFSWVVSAIQINREVGGELSGVLEKVGQTIRERMRHRRQIATLTAEGRLSAYILTALPIGISAYLAITNRDYFEPFAEAPGPALVALACALLLIGWIWMSRIIRSQL